ncbi:MAG: DUF488 domain-containing protein [Actinobacteria bacterium]|nr:MAG: DUF488 domain-containing protein [Actinomycetota bacterium]
MVMEFNTLFTVGYEAKSIDYFSQAIQESNIPVLIDVRNVAISRKPGFSKTKLASCLNENNIEYLHIQDLGAPKPIRSRYYQDRNFNAFKKAYLKHLNSTSGSLSKIIEILKEKSACLLCFEQSAQECHRSIVAEEIVKQTKGRVKIEHL